MTTIVTRAGKGSPLTHTEVDTNFTNLNTAKLEAGAIALGTAAAPSISFTGDTNTGVFSPGADQVAISTNGTGRVFVDASGNVGVGIGSPVDSLSYGSTLDIRGSTTGNGGVIYLGNSDATVRGFIAGYGDGRLDFGTSTNHPVKFFTNSSEKARIDSSGRLLVGTSSDSGGALLQVNGNRIRIATANTPASAGATGTTGEIAWDANYIYVCTATNTWKRVAISTW